MTPAAAPRQAVPAAPHPLGTWMLYGIAVVIGGWMLLGDVLHPPPDMDILTATRRITDSATASIDADGYDGVSQSSLLRHGLPKGYLSTGRLRTRYGNVAVLPTDAGRTVSLSFHGLPQGACHRLALETHQGPGRVVRLLVNGVLVTGALSQLDAHTLCTETDDNLVTLVVR